MKTDKKSIRSGKSINIKNLKILVTGGSGSVGRNIIKILVKKGAENILSISRDEGLIKEAESEINSPLVKFKIGDINDTQLVSRLLNEIDIVFHTAAIKHVSLAEKNPREAHRINVFSLLNLLDNSTSVKRFIHISSDKAIGVSNCYGATKLLGEYLVRETNNFNRGKYIIIRCPNLLGSRGSVTDLWKNQIASENKIKITDPEMTRYFITLPEAAEFITTVGLSRNPRADIIYYPLKYTKKYMLKDLAEAFVELFGNKKTKIEVIGTLPGEKKHEDYVKDVKLISKNNLKAILMHL